MPPQTDDDARDLDPRSSCAALYAHKLRQHRERAGLGQPEVGASCNVSGKTISAIENLRRLPTLDVSQKLDRLFGVDFFEDQYWQVIREAGLSRGFRNYAEMEELAVQLQIYEPLVIPGLFQTEAYAREVLRAGQTDERLERMIAIRLGRQEILEREDLHIVAVIKESVLREVVGGPEIMREQLAHLIELGRRHNVSIQVLRAGTPPYASGAFTLLGFTEGADLGYVEAAAGLGHMVEPPAAVRELALWFDQIRVQALPVPESEKLIISIMEAL